MAIYLAGDIQGCYQELRLLMQKINFDPIKDQAWFAGDLVARGPDSLSTLRFIKNLGSAATVVLGNHDLHLLAVHAGLKKLKANDRIDALLQADDADELMDWLASQPLLVKLPNDNAYMSHAGISPQWSICDAITQANNAQQKLSSNDRIYWLNKMYGNCPNNWLEAKTELERFRFTINALTRMRFCFQDGTMEFSEKGKPEHMQAQNLQPWYQTNHNLNDNKWVFGHWASLEGECPHKNVYALDTGCVWGGELTMLRWDDKQRFSIDSLNL